MTSNPLHPGHSLYQHLPSQQELRVRALRGRSNRHLNSFFSQVMVLKTHEEHTASYPITLCNGFIPSFVLSSLFSQTQSCLQRAFGCLTPIYYLSIFYFSTSILLDFFFSFLIICLNCLVNYIMKPPALHCSSCVREIKILLVTVTTTA